MAKCNPNEGYSKLVGFITSSWECICLFPAEYLGNNNNCPDDADVCYYGNGAGREGAGPVMNYIERLELSCYEVGPVKPVTWRYEEVELKGTISREFVMNFLAGTRNKWEAAKTDYKRVRTSRGGMIKAVNSRQKITTKGVDTSMTAGFSVPIKGVEVSGSLSVTTSNQVQNCIYASKEYVQTYTLETEKSVTSKITQTYTPLNKDGVDNPYDSVLWRETWTLGGVEINKQLHQTSKEDWDDVERYEDFDVTMEVGVDYQWYQLTTTNMGDKFSYECCENLMGMPVVPILKDYDQYSQKQQWRYSEEQQIVSRQAPKMLGSEYPHHVLTPKRFIKEVEAWPEAFMNDDNDRTWDMLPDGRIYKDGKCLWGYMHLKFVDCGYSSDQMRYYRNSKKFVWIPEVVHFADDESSSIV